MQIKDKRFANTLQMLEKKVHALITFNTHKFISRQLRILKQNKYSRLASLTKNLFGLL